MHPCMHMRDELLQMPQQEIQGVRIQGVASLKGRTVQGSCCEVGVHVFAYQWHNVSEVCQKYFRSQQSKGHAAKARAGSQFNSTFALDIRARELPLPGILLPQTNYPSDSPDAYCIANENLASPAHLALGRANKQLTFSRNFASTMLASQTVVPRFKLEGFCDMRTSDLRLNERVSRHDSDLELEKVLLGFLNHIIRTRTARHSPKLTDACSIFQTSPCCLIDKYRAGRLPSNSTIAGLL